MTNVPKNTRTAAEIFKIACTPPEEGSWFAYYREGRFMCHVLDGLYSNGRITLQEKSKCIEEIQEVMKKVDEPKGRSHVSEKHMGSLYAAFTRGTVHDLDINRFHHVSIDSMHRRLTQVLRPMVVDLYKDWDKRDTIVPMIQSLLLTTGRGYL